MAAPSTLRMWKRLRAVEVGASLPGMILQVKALDTIVQGALHKHSQAAFRVATFRMEIHLDERPTMTNVEQYLELLTAEMDYISHNGGPSQQLKVLQGSPSTPPRNGKRPCKFWGTPDGCMRSFHPPGQ